jgi:hypothetical protein
MAVHPTEIHSFLFCSFPSNPVDSPHHDIKELVVATLGAHEWLIYHTEHINARMTERWISLSHQPGGQARDLLDRNDTTNIALELLRAPNGKGRITRSSESSTIY